MKKSYKSGFTLVEVLVSILLTGLAFMLFLQALNTGKNVRVKSELRTRQSALLNSIENLIRARRFDENNLAPWTSAVSLGVDSNETSINQFLQGKPKKSINDFSRFLINSTIGLGGFIDVASKIGLERHEEDFGQTLAVWGVGQGPYIMLPGLGPSTLRDTLSRPVSSFSSVTFHMTDADVNIALKTIDAIETRERLLDVESLLSGDKYSFVKDAYIQSMNYEIADGIDVQDDFIDDMEDFLID